MNGKLNGHVTREQLAIEVQAEALRPVPPFEGHSLQERLTKAARRIHELERQVAALQKQHRDNKAQFMSEKQRQRRELGIQD